MPYFFKPRGFFDGENGAAGNTRVLVWSDNHVGALSGDIETGIMAVWERASREGKGAMIYIRGDETTEDFGVLPRWLAEWAAANGKEPPPPPRKELPEDKRAKKGDRG